MSTPRSHSASSRSHPDPSRRYAGLGTLLVLTGLIVNKWSVERVLAADEQISGGAFVAAIVALQGIAIGSGLWLIFRAPSLHIPGGIRAAAALLLVALIGGGIYGNLKALHVIDRNREFREAWQTMIASEEVIMALTGPVKRLGASVMNLELPDHDARSVFEPSVRFVDFAGKLETGLPQPFRTVDLGIGKGRIAEEVRTASIEDLRMWQALLDEAELFHFAKFYIPKGRFLNEARDEYETDLGFDGMARLRSGTEYWVHTSQKVSWKQHPPEGEDEEPTWKITSWRTESFDVMEVDQVLFQDVLETALEPEALARARRSIHEELVLEFLLDKESFEKPHFYFSLPAFDQHPGVAVVDLDRDGFDDFYVMERWGKNLFFRNRGDGTFEEIAGTLGLDIEDHTSSAIFADFDNDGDADAFLGRTLRPSVYLVNEGGRFVDRSADLVDGPLPQLVSSVSAVDYDGDGLLDVYVSTYAAEMTEIAPPDAFYEFLPEEDARTLETLRKSDHRNLARAGPPNTLFRNLGDGRFAVAPEGEQLKVFRNSYQSTWADFDGDGDPDVYVANDFSPNFLFRNDGGTFVDITDQTGTSDIGFGMGASWGDYDSDGRQDLYVTNMYSKAGLRITSQLSQLEPRFAKMARGNSLFRNGPDGFEKVSGLEKPDLLVEKGGWGWGSQFVDVDNDGHLDLYALSGYYTAPKEVELPVDI